VLVMLLNCAAARFAVDATRAPTLTCEPAPNRIPFGFSTSTVPGALIAPRIWLGDALGSLTRLSTVQLLPPWLNRRVVLTPILKLVQVRSAHCRGLVHRDDLATGVPHCPGRAGGPTRPSAARRRTRGWGSPR